MEKTENIVYVPISVKERLPKENGFYGVIIKDCEDSGLYTAFFNKGIWERGTIEEVTHWLEPRVIPSKEKDAKLSIKDIQDQLPWTIHYSKEFRESGLSHKDFQHALIHAVKATGKLSTYVDNLDHNKESEVGDIDKYLADLVICAMRMANTHKVKIDLQKATIDRLEGKNGVKLAQLQPKETPKDAEQAFEEYWKETMQEIIFQPNDVTHKIIKLAFMAGFSHRREEETESYWPVCDVNGCEDITCSQGSAWRDTGYWCVCPKHSQMSRDKKPQPEMKPEAIAREKGRDEKGYLPPPKVLSHLITVMETDKKILDACCGSRMFWFDKSNPDALFMDIRSEKYELNRGTAEKPRIQKKSIAPDVVADFRNMPFDDNTFYLVVLDPPHLNRLGKTSYTAKNYGVLLPTWETDIKAAFDESMRVLKPNGTLIFKWNESQISTSKILSLIPYKPLFGHTTGRQAKTIWLTFMKTNN